MPEEVIETINNPGSDTEDGESSAPDLDGQTTSPFSDGDDVVPTRPEELAQLKSSEEEPQTPEEEVVKDKEEEPKTEPEEKRGAEKRIKQLLDLREQDASRMEALERKLAALEKPQEETPPYEDVSGKTNEEILEALEEDPLGFLKNFAQQVRYEVKQDMLTTQQEAEQQKSLEEFQSRAGKTYGKFAEEHPEFQTMWDDGKLKNYMDDNPGHNAISAYLMLNKDTLVSKEEAEKAQAEAVTKAIAETEKKFNARKTTTGSVLKTDPSSGDRSQSKIDPLLQDTSKVGGKVSAIAQHLERFRQRRR